MSKQPTYKKILEHPDKDEIISKLVIGISPTDIHDWLQSKYTNVSESKFILSEKMVKSFKDNYLDFYNDMIQDLTLVKSAVATNTQDQLKLTVQSNPQYKDALLKVANNEWDIEKTMAIMVMNVETRLAQIFDIVQEDPRNINTKVERLMNDMVETLGGLLDKYHKWKEKPAADQIIQHNVTLQVVDQHISVFHDVIKEVLSQMDLETSLYFMEVFNDKMSKLKQPDGNGGGNVPPSQEIRMAEVKLLNETINQKINQ
jgi:hypothetical protein